VATVNADETLMAGAFSDGDDRGWQRGETPAAAATAKGPDMGNTAAAQPTVGGAQPTVQTDFQAARPDGTPMVFAEAKESRLHEQLARVRAEPPGRCSRSTRQRAKSR